MISLTLALTMILSPWKGPLPAAGSSDASAYRLSIHGIAGQHVHLRAEGLPGGWIATFCTGELCSPMRYTMQLDSRGSGTIEFQAIRLEDSAPRRARVILYAGDGASTVLTVTAH